MRRPFTRGPIPRPEIQRKHKINDEITASEVRVLDTHGEPLGVMNRRDALKLAQDREADLVLIAPQASPPVCRIIDYGKFSYQQQKKEKEQKKQQHQQILKEIRLRAGTDTHDLDFKSNHARRFLLEGNKVKATVMFRGREIVHQDLGRALLQEFVDGLADVSKIDQDIRSEGRTLSVTLAPEIKKVAKAEKSKTPKLENSKTEKTEKSKTRKLETKTESAIAEPEKTTETTVEVTAEEKSNQE